jgi:transcriptional regulator with XRE-family HTH domain
MAGPVSMMKVQRVVKGLSQPNLELLTKIPQYRLSLIERGITAKDDEIKKICEALEVQEDRLFLNGRAKHYEAEKS